ncbi:hypothetical protein [Candidatus Contubernalis alkaliaceticus]|uniref:hypothetical protein n=1 Tax=Candidatus Contubernalis alkaliaceticus TaxID=338645 RepID=UPI001F4C1EFF|nr:hypothetical protein [Candidatus Contubernalis alkalaceticus]UNC92748.1 hypothetical protein HUE98_11960 [Candidatus Contubernalis alkalaceticus]
MTKNKDKSFRSCNQSCSDSVEFSDPLDENIERKSIVKEENTKKQNKSKKKNKNK